MPEPLLSDSGRTAVMACTHPYWSALQVGSQHIARQLVARGWRVIYLSAPVTPLHFLRLSSFELKRRFGAALRGPTLHCQGRLEAHVPFACVGPDGRDILRRPLVTANWWRTSLNGALRAVLREPEVDLLYIDNLSYAFLLDELSPAHTMFRVMDHHERFGGWEGRAHELAARIAGRADLTVYSAESLEPYVRKLGSRNALCVPNGVDFAAFAGSPCSGVTRPAVLAGIPDPVVLYSGAIDDRIDFDLVADAAIRMSDVSFVFVGPPVSGLKCPAMPGNVHFVGAVGHEELPGCMRCAVAGMVPFDVSGRGERVEGVRPLKLLEYMAAGLPAICATWTETMDPALPVWRYRNVEEFVRMVFDAISGQYDPAPGREYARRAGWEAAVGRMLDELGAE